MERVEGRTPQQIGREVLGSTVLEGAPRSGSRYRPKPAPLILGDVAVMEDHPIGYVQPALAPSLGEREVNLRGQHIRQVVHSECSSSAKRISSALGFAAAQSFTNFAMSKTTHSIFVSSARDAVG